MKGEVWERLEGGNDVIIIYLKQNRKKENVKKLGIITLDIV